MSMVKISAAAVLCAAAALPACASAAPGAQVLTRPTATSATVVLDCQGARQTKPRTYVLACGDGNNYLTGLRWTAWRAGSATARGTDVANDCVPYCAAGHFHSYPASVVLDRPKPWTGHTGVDRFSRLTLHYPGTRPAGMASTVVLPLP
jgi:hypothetical protein